MRPATGRHARGIDSRERRTGRQDRKTQDCWRGETKNKLRKRIQEKLKIEEARVKMRADLVRKTREEERKERKPDIKVKLPKLEITKFTGNRLDWTHFWVNSKQW